MNSKSYVFTLILLTLFNSFCLQAPAFSNEYEVGSEYTYEYKTWVTLNDKKSDSQTTKDVGFKLESLVGVAPLWINSAGDEQILELKVLEPKLLVRGKQSSPPGEFVEKSSKIGDLSKNSFYFHRKNGVVTRIFSTPAESVTFLNIKKGIASIFSFSTKNTERDEEYTSGKCRTKYLVERSKIEKSRFSCDIPENFLFHSNINQAFNSLITSQSKTNYELNDRDGSIKRSQTNEMLTMQLRGREKSLVEIVQKQELAFKEKTTSKSQTYSGAEVSQILDKISQKLGVSLTPDSLTISPVQSECIACRSLKDLVSSFRKSFLSSALGKEDSVLAFVRILSKMRQSDAKTITQVLKNSKNSKILPQLLDLAAATQTVAAHDAVKNVLKFDDVKNIGAVERYLTALSLSTHPHRDIIEDLLKILRKGVSDSRVLETLLLSISAMTKTFDRKNPDNSLSSDVSKIFLGGLNSCKDQNCILIHIRTLKNFQNRATVLTVLEYAKSSNRKESVYAMRALQTMPDSFINDQVRLELENILFEIYSKHDSSVRSMAAEILLRCNPENNNNNPDNNKNSLKICEQHFYSVLRSVMEMFKTKKSESKELFTLLWSFMADLCEKNPEVDKIVKNILSDTAFNNYHVLSHAGMSSAFSRPLVSNSQLNMSFTNMLEISGGILKRSNVDVFVEVGSLPKFRILSFGMFAGGLSMFSSDDSNQASGQDEEEATAGIEISLMDSQLRPFVLFNGQGELMGHVWSGTASERTTALQGTVLLHDHKEVRALQNGFTVELLLTGAISFDFAGQVQISLWNRNANSLVEVNSAALIQGQARVESPLVQSMVEFNVEAETRLNFKSSLDFSDDIMMCLDMVQLNFDVKDSVRKFERIPNKNYVLRRSKNMSCPVSGKTYVMNKKNTQLCTKMYKNMAG